jgi:putative ABC transport system permease protein
MRPSGRRFGGRRFSVTTIAVFGVAAMVLTVIGLYGVLAHLVSLRGREIGIRIALGAEHGKIVGMVLGEGVRLIGLGVALGLGSAYASMRLMRRLLFGVEAFDPALFTSVTALLVAVAILACLVPARRAARVDPNLLLRD